MARNDDEREFRLRPTKPRVRREDSAWATGFKLLTHYARASRYGRSSGSGRGAGAHRAHNQRCAVRAVYSRNDTKGKWRAHGRYLARESATLEANQKAVGFSADNERIELSNELDRWQSAGDPLLWKLIVSPEFGDLTDLPQLTREMMRRVAEDLNTDVEWVAVAHHNTEHPHVHIALRGIRANGQPLQLDRDYIKNGLRGVAEELCTAQLGYRTEMDAEEAERREVMEVRFTSLDRRIFRAGTVASESGGLHVRAEMATGEMTRSARVREQHVAGRLAVLESMGLATANGPGNWVVRGDFESVLRAMQRTNDHQKTLSAHGVLPSDERLPIEVLQWQNYPEGVQGRILVHGQEEFSGRGYLMLEGTDAHIHFIQYSPEMDMVRSQGGLRTNSFVRLRRMFGITGQPVVDVQEAGDSEKLLGSRSHFEVEAQKLIKRGIQPTDDGWGGWLGKYQSNLCEATSRASQMQNRARERDLKRDRGLDR
jgi:type IV secretory pathway VirD2 relaxase